MLPIPRSSQGWTKVGTNDAVATSSLCRRASPPEKCGIWAEDFFFGLLSTPRTQLELQLHHLRPHQLDLGDTGWGQALQQRVFMPALCTLEHLPSNSVYLCSLAKACIRTVSLPYHPWQCSGEKSREDPHQPLPCGFLRGRTPSGRCWEATPTGLGAVSTHGQLENHISISRATPRSPASANTGMCGMHRGPPRHLSHAGTSLCPVKNGNLVMALTRERCSAVRCS